MKTTYLKSLNAQPPKPRESFLGAFKTENAVKRVYSCEHYSRQILENHTGVKSLTLVGEFGIAIREFRDTSQGIRSDIPPSLLRRFANKVNAAGSP